MKTIQSILCVLALALCGAGRAAEPSSYMYVPVNGVHEVKFFHGCFDDDNVDKRRRINIVMQGLALADVDVAAQVAENGKPTSAMITLRVKGRDASLKSLFHSHDGPHCQQGVQSIEFLDQTVRSAAQLGIRR